MEIIRLDGILWHVMPIGKPIPLCPKHRMELDPVPGEYANDEFSTELHCEDCDKAYPIPRYLYQENEYIKKKVASKAYASAKVLNIDGESVPVAETSLSSLDGEFFVTGVLTESRVGNRLVLYAGKKGEKNKTQIFIEPEIKRIAFDQNDLHPTDVFLKVEATFIDGTKASIEKGEAQPIKKSNKG